MKKAIQNPKQTRWALGITWALISLLPATGLSQDLANRFRQSRPSSEAASYLAEVPAPETRDLSFTRTGNQTESGMQRITVCSFLTDIHNCKAEDWGTAIDRLSKKNSLVQKYGLDTGLALYNGSIWVGMTSEMVAESIGEPCEVIVHDCGNKVWVQWVYEFYNLCLCFEDQVLSAIRYD